MTEFPQDSPFSRRRSLRVPRQRADPSSIVDGAVEGRSAADEPPIEALAIEAATEATPIAPAGASAPLAQQRADQVIDGQRIFDRLRRLASFDSTVFAEIVDDVSLTLSAYLIAIGAIMLAAIGGWLALIVDVNGLSTGRIALREFLLGSVLAFVFWLAAVFVVRMVLQSTFRRRVDHNALIRTMGYATVPLAGALFMPVPELSFAVGLVSIVAWFMLSSAAVEQAAPDASRREALAASGVGLGLFVVAMSLLAEAGGLAPGFFIHAADLSAYV